MKLSKVLFLAAFTMIFSQVFAEVPANTEENSFNRRISVQMAEVTNLINDGIKSIRQEVVSSEYDTNRSTGLGGAALNEKESGSESVTSKEVLYYEPKEEIYEAREAMDDILIWLDMYRTVNGDDFLTFKKIKQAVNDKAKTLDKIINALKYEKDNRNSIMELKIAVKKADKEFERNMTKLKGKIALIEGKPLPEPTKDDE
ncbi:MAG: hypothetical protein LLG37_07860 [Spirochaetia bacterium]|nr:hypothetical protein [Spirochaetia bacterium]